MVTLEVCEKANVRFSRASYMPDEEAEEEGEGNAESADEQEQDSDDELEMLRKAQESVKKTYSNSDITLRRQQRGSQPRIGGFVPKRKK
jgi:hypothetical protein